MRDALDMGVDVAGGCPHLDDDRLGCLEACLEVAAAAGRPIDLHVDETLDPEVLGLRDFARLVARTGFPHGATASHCVSLGMQEENVQKAVAAEVAEAGMAVVTLPQTNLFLQGHGHVTGMPRGLTALEAPARRRCDPRWRRRQRAGPFQHDGPRRPARDCRARW